MADDSFLAAADAVDRRCLLDLLETVSRISSPTEQGITRLGYTEGESLAHEAVGDALWQVGCQVKTDPFGNLFGMLGPAYEETGSSPLVLSGSHLDSVPKGGPYDGSLGVVMAIEAARVLKKLGIRGPYRYGVVAWRCEESARFGIGRLGSRAALAELSLEEANRLTDKQGITLAEAMSQQGWRPGELGNRTPYTACLHSYWETHIEQGPVLERLGVPVGVVTGISNQTRLRVRVRGETRHSGGTPMAVRRDAVAGAAEMTLALERIVKYCGGSHSVGHVGNVTAFPGRANTIAGLAELLIDIRDQDEASKDRVTDAFAQEVERICARRGLTSEIETLYRGIPQTLPSCAVDLLSETASRLGITHHLLPSGGGHDANNLSRFVPVGMLFVPSPGAVSHDPSETVNPDHVVEATRVLVASIVRLVTADWGLPRP